MDDDFFSIGGASLTAVRVVMRLRQLGVPIDSVSVLLSNPKLSDFATAIASAANKKEHVGKEMETDIQIKHN